MILGFPFLCPFEKYFSDADADNSWNASRQMANVELSNVVPIDPPRHCLGGQKIPILDFEQTGKLHETNYYKRRHTCTVYSDD